MSASVLARSYTESPQHSPQHSPQFVVGPRGPVEVLPPSTAAGDGAARNSSLRRERPRLSGSGMRISFASGTRFVERTPGSRSSSRSAATSYNLRPVQGTERLLKAKVRLPKATASTGSKYAVVPEDEYLNPRRALDIAKSYGIPKYFLRGNTQVMTDGRMRLFGDNVWKKERTCVDSDRAVTADSSDVINRLMDSVDKAIATAKKLPPTSSTSADDESALKLEIISLKSGGGVGGGGGGAGGVGADDSNKTSSLRGSVRSLQGAASAKSEIPPSTAVTAAAAAVVVPADGGGTGGQDVSVEGGTSERRVSFNKTVCGVASTEGIETSGRGFSGNISHTNHTFPDFRPHTVDTTAGTLVRYLPKVVQTDSDLRNSGKFDHIGTRGLFIGTPQTPGSRGKLQLASPFRGASGTTGSRLAGSSMDDKYQNVLPRFYPAVNAHQSRQAEAERAARGAGAGKKKLGQHHRLVRFADTHTVRFSSESIPTLVAQRAPVQSVQRSLDSHSGLSQAERFRRQKEIAESAEENLE